MYIKTVKTKYKKKTYEYIRVVKSETPWCGRRKEVVIATLGSIDDVRPHIRQIIAGLKAVALR